MKTLSKSLIVAAIAGAVSLPVVAGKYRHYDSYNNSSVDYAKVVNVSPMVESYQVNNPVEQCWDERVPSRRYSKNKSYTPEVVGAIVGAAVGNRFGKGSGRDAATVAGALLGTTIGRDVKHRNHRNHYSDRSYDVVQRCEMRDSYTTEERVVGYNVEYKYRGNLYQTTLDERPGDRIKVKVTVDPV